MKIYLLSLLLLANSIVYAQLTPTVELLRKPTFRGDIRKFSYTGTALYTAGYDYGLRSFVAKSSDLGQSWEILQQSFFNPSDNLNGLTFSGNTGIVVGANGKIYRSTDGGANWVNRTDSTLYTSGFNDVELVSSTIGYACGGAVGAIQVIKTTDAGLSWTGLVTGQTNTMYDMYWDNTLTGWIAGTSQKIVRTTDGGATWTACTTPTGTISMYTIKRASASVFYAAGTAGTVLKSTDNGVTFAAVTSPTTAAIYTLETFSENEVLILGSSGLAFRTTDGGATWLTIPAFTSEVIRTSLKVGSKLLAGAYKSTICESVDNGVSWSLISQTYRDLYGIFQEGNNIVTVGERSEILVSNDNGAAWSKKSFLMANLLYDVYLNGNNIHVSGQVGNYFTSSDGGATWTNRSNGSPTSRNYKMYFFNANQGYMVSNDGIIYYTTDRGANWQTQVTFATTTLYDIRMLSSTAGFAVGSGSRIFSTSNGSLWGHGTLAQPAEQLTGVNLVDAMNGYICGENGTVYKTTDGFNTVTMIADTNGAFGKTMYDIVYFAPGEVWACRKDGALLRMNGQGVMVPVWTAMYGESLNGMFKVDQNSFLVCGSSGTVYRVSLNPVPAELVSFSCSVETGKAVLQWVTATEKNNSGFRVEKKIGGEWIEAGFVRGAGTTTDKQHYSFTDKSYSGGSEVYRLAQIDFDGTTKYSAEIETGNIVTDYYLGQNYPNPFNPETMIKYQIPMINDQSNAVRVSLKVYDILGKEVAALVNETKQAGSYTVNFNASNLPSGIYIYELRAGDFKSVKKMTLIR